VAPMFRLFPDMVPADWMSMRPLTVDYDAWIGKCDKVAAKYDMEFRLVHKSVKNARGKLLIFGQLNPAAIELDDDEAVGADWSHCVAVDSHENHMECRYISKDRLGENAAYGRDGWLSKYKYFSKIERTYRLTKKRQKQAPPLTKRRKRPHQSKDQTSPKRKKIGFVYDSQTISSRDSKKQANELFSASLDTVCKKMAPGMVVYLDGDDGNTSGFISDYIKRRHNLLVINMDPLVIAALASLNTGASLLATTVNRWSMRVTEASIVGCWLDYCGTLYGAPSSSCPFADICNLVYRKAFRPGGIVAITLCTRDAKTCDSSTALPLKLLQMFKGNYPAAAIHDVFSYTSMIYFSITV
jgi:hypothetical protein